MVAGPRDGAVSGFGLDGFDDDFVFHGGDLLDDRHHSVVEVDVFIAQAAGFTAAKSAMQDQGESG